MSIISVVSEVRWNWTTDGMPSYTTGFDYLQIPSGMLPDTYGIDYISDEVVVNTITYNQQTATFWTLSNNFETVTPNTAVPSGWHAFDWTNRQVIFYDTTTHNIKYFSLDNPSNPWTIPPLDYIASLYYTDSLYMLYTPAFLLISAGSPFQAGALGVMSLYPLTNLPSLGHGVYTVPDIIHSLVDNSSPSFSFYQILGYSHTEQVVYLKIWNLDYSKLVQLPLNNIHYDLPNVAATSFNIIGDFPAPPANALLSSSVNNPVCVYPNPTDSGLLSWWLTNPSSGVFGQNGLELFYLDGLTWKTTGVVCPFPVFSVVNFIHSKEYTYFDFYCVSPTITFYESWRVSPSTGVWESLLTSPREDPTGVTYFKPPGKTELWALGGVKYHEEEINVWDTQAQTWNYPVGFWSFLNMRTPPLYIRPSGRSDSAIAYDDINQRYLLMGGRVTNWAGTRELAIYNDLWQFVPETYEWSLVQVSGSDLPDPRAGHSFVYNRIDGCFYLYGGVESLLLPLLNTPFDVVWRFDPTNSIWTTIAGGPGTAEPTPRYGHGSIVRPANNSMYILGGTKRDGTVLLDFWRLDLSTHSWSRISENIGSNSLHGGTFIGPIKCAYDETHDAMYVLSSSGSIIFFTYYFGTKQWKDSTYGLQQPDLRLSGLFYDNVEDELFIFALHTGAVKGQLQLVRHTQIETEPHALPLPEFELPAKKICEDDRTKMIPMDDCAWWWEGSDLTPFLNVEERACKVGSVRVRYSKYKRVKDHPLAFFSQVLEGGPNLYIEHEGISCRFNIPDGFLVDTNYPNGDFDIIVIVPDSTLYEPIILNTANNNEILLDQSGYVSGDYNVYMTSFDPLWNVLKDGYLGAAVLSKEDPNTGSHLRGRINGTIVYAVKVGRVKLKMSLSRDKFISDPYIGDTLELVPGTGQMKKISLYPGSETYAYIGLMNCCVYWQSHYVSGGPIYLAVEYVTDEGVLGYDYSVAIRTCILPQNIDLDGMVRSGRIEAPPFPERYFHTTLGSSEAPVAYGTQISADAKWYQISSDNGMIGGIMPSVGDAILIEILMQPPSLVQEDLSAVYKAPFGISSAAIRVKHTAESGYLKTQRSNFDQVPRIPQDEVIPTVTSAPSGTKGVYFFLSLTDATSDTVTTFLDSVQSRACALSGDASLIPLQNPGGSNLTVCLGSSTTSDWKGCLVTDPSALGIVLNTAESSAEYLYPEDQFILSSYLYLDVDNANSSGYDITCSIDLLRVGIERKGNNIEELPVDSYFFQSSWGFYTSSIGAPTDGHYLSCALSILRTRYFFLYWGCDHLYFVPDAMGFQLDPLALPYKTWFKLALTRNRTTNEYAWLVDGAVLKDEHGKDCRWTSKTYWYSTPSVERYRGSSSAEAPFYPRLLDAQGVQDAYIYACYYELDKFNTLI